MRVSAKLKVAAGFCIGLVLLGWVFGNDFRFWYHTTMNDVYSRQAIAPDPRNTIRRRVVWWLRGKPSRQECFKRANEHCQALFDSGLWVQQDIELRHCAVTERNKAAWVASLEAVSRRVRDLSYEIPETGATHIRVIARPADLPKVQQSIREFDEAQKN